MKSEIQSDIDLILTLLNNAEELVTISNSRDDAKKVLQAIKIFAQGHQVKVPEPLINELIKNIVDFPPQKISNNIKQIAREISLSNLD